MTFPIRRFAGLSPVPWANGAGWTTTLAAGNLDGFRSGSIAPTEIADVFDADWRLSIARLDGPSAFSVVAGFDRVFTVIGEEPVELTIDGRRRTVAPFDPMPFAGEAVVRCRPTGSSALALNLFSRRRALSGEVVVATVSTHETRIAVAVDEEDVAGGELGGGPLRIGDHWWEPAQGFGANGASRRRAFVYLTERLSDRTNH